MVYNAHRIIEASVTRPADGSAYAVNDVLSDSVTTPTVMTFSNAARLNIRSGVVRNALLIDSANQATAGDFRLFLFDTEPTAMEDNAAFDPTDAELANVVGVINFTTDVDGNAAAGASGNAIYSNDAPARYRPYQTGTSLALYGIMTVQNAYTPVSGETLTVRLGILQD